jgi:hypothetical protein
MAYIGVQPTDTYLSIASQQITGTGSATYTLDYSVSNEEDVAVFVNNVRQNVSSYTVSGNQLTLGGTISASDECWVLFLGRTVGTKTPAVGSVTNDMLAGSIATSKLANQNIGFRNLIINGDMSIAQRGTSVSSITSTGYRTCDRFQPVMNSSGTWTISQSTDVPTAQGFANSFKFDCTTAEASPNYLFLKHAMEGQMLQQLKKGTSNAESLTLSFWVKSNLTGTYQVNIRDEDNSRLIGNTYAISSADTWEKKTITFEGDTTGALDNDNNTSLYLEWWLDSGSTYNTGSVPTSWESASNADRASGLTVNLADNTANEWYITGVQLEVGTSASDFEFLPYDVNLQRCQRYYEEAEMFSIGAYIIDHIIHAKHEFKTTKRADPSISFSGTSTVYVSGATPTTSAQTSNTIDKDGFFSRVTTTGTTNSGKACTVYGINFKADAEL